MVLSLPEKSISVTFLSRTNRQEGKGVRVGRLKNLIRESRQRLLCQVAPVVPG